MYISCATSEHVPQCVSNKDLGDRRHYCRESCRVPFPSPQNSKQIEAWHCTLHNPEQLISPFNSTFACVCVCKEGGTCFSISRSPRALESGRRNWSESMLYFKGGSQVQTRHVSSMGQTLTANRFSICAISIWFGSLDRLSKVTVNNNTGFLFSRYVSSKMLRVHRLHGLRRKCSEIRKHVRNNQGCVPKMCR